MSEVNYEGMRANVSLLGTILGEIISDAEGVRFLEKIEKIRLLSKSAKAGNAEDGESLLEIIRALKNDELVPVARAFSQFLNLANIADQQYSHSREMDDIFSATETLKTVFNE